MYIRLSYDLDAASPTWPGNPTLALEKVTSMDDGDVANTFNINLFNHYGSHMDGPKHFNNQGANLHELSLENFIYERPVMIDIAKSFAEFITKDELHAHADILDKADVLLIRTGFSEQRVAAPERYSAEGPALHSTACKYLMDHYPGLKAIALDFISLGSYAHGPDGVLAHQYMLGMYHDHAICIIEDLDFSGVQPDRLKRVFSLPLFIKGVDSAPVTVVAECS